MPRHYGAHSHTRLKKIVLSMIPVKHSVHLFMERVVFQLSRSKNLDGELVVDSIFSFVGDRIVKIV